MQHKTANKLLTSLAESGRTGRTINHILCQHSPASLMQWNTDEWYRCLVSAIQNEYEYFNEVSAPIPILVSVHPYINPTQCTFKITAYLTLNQRFSKCGASPTAGAQKRSDEGQVGLEKAPLFKVGNDRKSLRTTVVVEDGESWGIVGRKVSV